MKKETLPNIFVKPPETFIGSARIQGAGESPGFELKLEFRHMGKKESLQWWEDIAKDKKRLAVEALCDVVVRIQGQDEKWYDASPQVFEQLTDNYPKPFADIVNAWMDQLKAGRAKNS